MDTLGARKAISSFLRIWSQQVPDAKEDEQFQAIHPDQPASGDVVYYEPKLGSMIPQAKAYVEHLCPHDIYVSRAIGT
jgi:hypothetical protein